MAGQIAFLPTEADIIDANRDWYRRRGRRRIPLLIAGTGIGFAFFASLIAPNSSTTVLAIVSVVEGLVMSTVVTLALLLQYLLVIPFYARRQLRQRRSLHNEIGYGWSDKGIDWRMSDGAGTTKWSDFHRWHEGRTAFLFFLSDNLFYFLPHRALADEAAADLRATATASGLARL